MLVSPSHMCQEIVFLLLVMSIPEMLASCYLSQNTTQPTIVAATIYDALLIHLLSCLHSPDYSPCIPGLNIYICILILFIYLFLDVISIAYPSSCLLFIFWPLPDSSWLRLIIWISLQALQIKLLFTCICIHICHFLLYRFKTDSHQTCYIRCCM